ncbi:hypothetical protein VTN49DRAFT_6111 [Thermomyces lanuginosus]|uniref:uncharacterized protein n=1 Tax=Thermomyces lanuginosus TaxID=5541 RepID=UPI00374434CB
MHPRAVLRTVLAKSQSEGVGATVRRTIGTPRLRNLSPFLMMDHFTIRPGAGFPDHPHRGQETVTYLLSGAGVDHEDFAGHRGTIKPGDLQFMTAGKGVMHAEMPHIPEGLQEGDVAETTGLQLWLDLPRELKKVEPRYRDLRGDVIPEVQQDEGKVTVKVISGESQGVRFPEDPSKEVFTLTPLWFLDVTIRPGGTLRQPVPVGWTVVAYILEGNVSFTQSNVEGDDHSDDGVETYHTVVFKTEGDHIYATSKNGTARFVLLAGQPLDQPVVQYGPFVCSTEEEIYQALFDFQTASNGFERARGWRSEIGKRMAY